MALAIPGGPGSVLLDAVQRIEPRSCPREFMVETSEVVFYGEVRPKEAEGKVGTSSQSHFEVNSSEVVLI